MYEPTLIDHYAPDAQFTLGVHSWCGAIHAFWQVRNDMYPPLSYCTEQFLVPYCHLFLILNSKIYHLWFFLWFYKQFTHDTFPDFFLFFIRRCHQRSHWKPVWLWHGQFPCVIYFFDLWLIKFLPYRAHSWLGLYLLPGLLDESRWK